MHAPAHRFHIDVFYCRHIITVCDFPAQFMEKIPSLVPDFFMTQCETASLPEIILAAFHTAGQFPLFPRKFFLAFSVITGIYLPCFLRKHCHSMHRIINPQNPCIPVRFSRCLVFTVRSLAQQAGIIFSGRFPAYRHRFQTAVFRDLPVLFHPDPFQLRKLQPLPVHLNVSVYHICCIAVFVSVF